LGLDRAVGGSAVPGVGESGDCCRAVVSMLGVAAVMYAEGYTYCGMLETEKIVRVRKGAVTSLVGLL